MRNRATHLASIAHGLGMTSMIMLGASPAFAQNVPLTSRQGWVVKSTPASLPLLASKLEDAIKANTIGIVTMASASEGAMAQGFTIPGNGVVGVFRNDFAWRMLAASIPAGIEAPIRFYLTEEADGTATLSYKTPSPVFSPCIEGSGTDLTVLASELNVIFARIAEAATTP